ncbi:MAG: ATP-binding cassette domain-containing protein, partial [Chloroflexaceae bacterium]|nr:ATP-binding cassette domain-containing protein [Chloroflexaceae bacterium]
IPVMTVAENIMLGEEVTRFGEVLDEDEAERRVRELSQQYGLEVDPHAIVEELPVGMQQRVEIVKALYRNADILILDEPTAVLTPQESEELFRVMRDLAARGVSIIFISHKLKEVLSVAHRIMVMRDGRVVGETTPAEATEATLAAMMVGRDVILQVPKGAAHPGEPVLRVIGLSALDDRKHQAVNNVSFEVRAGEILGIAGVQGNG